MRCASRPFCVCVTNGGDFVINNEVVEEFKKEIDSNRFMAQQYTAVVFTNEETVHSLLDLYKDEFDVDYQKRVIKCVTGIIYLSSYLNFYNWAGSEITTCIISLDEVGEQHVGFDFVNYMMTRMRSPCSKYPRLVLV